ncbi:MAG: glycosyltransferase, exosortase A system-associated [Burkholderiaceae bacterium]|nr:glycosyltransferase, exosortase A system-associated [Burkholderiaceae bacterium]
MKILHVFDHSLPVQDGYSYRSLAILQQQRARGWQTAQVTGLKHAPGQAVAPVEEAAGLRFHRTTERGGAMVRLPVIGGHLEVVTSLKRRIAEVAAEVRPDLIHAHSPSLNGLAALAVARARRVPLVYEIRAFWEDAAVDQGTAQEGDLRYRLTRASETHVLRRAGAVFTICDGLKQDLLARGLPATKVTVIPNAVNAGDFAFSPPRDEALAAQLGLQEALVLGFIGSFYAYEGLDLLLDAFPSIAARLPHARLLLVGGGLEDVRLRAQAQRLGLADRIVFTGRVPHDQVARYYSLLDLALFPRHSLRLTETVTPLKPLEAMAMGTVCVASDVGGHRELIADGVTGHLFRAGSADALAAAVERAVRDPESLARVRAQGRRFVETERSWAASVARAAPVYERLLAGR